MSYWDSQQQKTIHREPFAAKLPGWVYVDCHCCNGFQWGGDTPRDCDSCAGIGWRCIHIESGRAAKYPGGSFLGMAGDDELAKAKEFLDILQDLAEPSQPPVTNHGRHRIRSYCLNHNEGQ